MNRYQRIIERVFLDLIAMFEVTLEDHDIKLVQEKHYRLVPASDVTQDAGSDPRPATELGSSEPAR